MGLSRVGAGYPARFVETTCAGGRKARPTFAVRLATTIQVRATLRRRSHPRPRRVSPRRFGAAMPPCSRVCSCCRSLSPCRAAARRRAVGRCGKRRRGTPRRALPSGRERPRGDRSGVGAPQPPSARAAWRASTPTAARPTRPAAGTIPACPRAARRRQAVGRPVRRIAPAAGSLWLHRELVHTASGARGRGADRGSCRSDAECAVDLGAGRCVPVADARDVLRVGPIDREVRTATASTAAALGWAEPLPCTSDAECWWERKADGSSPRARNGRASSLSAPAATGRSTPSALRATAWCAAGPADMRRARRRYFLAERPSSIRCVLGSYLDEHLARIMVASKWPASVSSPSAVTSTPPCGASRKVSGTTHCG